MMNNSVNYFLLSDVEDANTSTLLWKGIRLLLAETLSFNEQDGSLICKGGIRNIPSIAEFQCKWESAKSVDGYFQIVLATCGQELLGFIIFVIAPEAYCQNRSENHKFEIFSSISCQQNCVFFDLGIVEKNIRNSGRGVFRGMLSHICERFECHFAYGLISPYNAYAQRVVQYYGGLFLASDNGLTYVSKMSLHFPFQGKSANWLLFELPMPVKSKNARKFFPPSQKISSIVLQGVCGSDGKNRYAIWGVPGDNGLPEKKHGYLLDRISGYALCTSKPEEVLKGISIPVFDYNDFQDDQLGEYDAISERIQRESYAAVASEIQSIVLAHSNTLEVLDICGGKHSKWRENSQIHVTTYDARNGIDGCIDIHRFRPVFVADIASADIILMQNALARLYDYGGSNGRDYTQQEKRAFVRNVCNVSPVNGKGQDLLLLESDCKNAVSYMDVCQQVKVFYPECNDADWMKKWAAFWWYAMAEKCLFPVLANVRTQSRLGAFRVREINNIQQFDSLIQSRRVVKLYKLSRPLRLIYKVSFVESTFLKNQLSFFTQGVLSKTKYLELLEKNKAAIGNNRIVDFIQKYRRLHACQDEEITFVFLVTDTVFDEQFVKSISPLLFLVDVVYVRDGSGKEYFNSRFGTDVVGDPIVSCVSILNANFLMLQSMLPEAVGPLGADRIVSITIGKYSALLQGSSTLSANYLFNESLDIGVIFGRIRTLLNEINLEGEKMWRGLVLKQSLKSAVASIMSRNGSHNIGSHVLSALSHNVGTMPDDKVLYQYIQHRMDYIASATTGAPDWSVPTPFVGNLMKMFYSQRHLLEHIAESDGLHAYQYQGKGTQIGAGQKDCVKIVVRRISHNKCENGEEWEHKEVFGHLVHMYEFFCDTQRDEKDKAQKNLNQSSSTDRSKANESAGNSEVVPDEEKERVVHWNHDESVSIPGGILGQHAFYNIVENVLRNAAKHSWAGKKPAERGAENLEIYVDFEKNQPDESEQPDGMMCFTVGDNMSKLFPGAFWDDCFRYLDSCANTTPLPKGRTCWAEVFALPLDGFHVPLEGETSNRQRIEEFLEGKVSSEGLPLQYKALYEYVTLKCKWKDLKENDSFMAALKGKPDKDENGIELDGLGHRLPLPLHHRQEMALAEPFINLETNRLRQSAWGLSEMKISAGYLRRAEVSVIGGLEHPKQGEHPLIVPLGIPRVGNGQETNWQDLCLAYRFWINLPKDVLIVADPTPCSFWKTKVKDWEGFDVKTYGEVLGQEGDIGLMSDYEFVLIDHIKGKEKREEDGKNDKWEKDDKLKLPFRALEIAGDPQKGALSLPCVPEGALREAGTRTEFVECVYRAWLDDLKHRRVSETAIPADLKIRLKIYETEGSENGLINDKDIYKVLFSECLHSVLEPIANSSRLKKSQREALLLVSLYPLDKNNPWFDCMPESFDGHDDMLKELLGKMAGEVLRFLDFPLSNDYAQLRRAYQSGLERVKERIEGEGWLKIQPILDFISLGKGSEGIAELKDELQNMADNNNSPLIATAAEALDVARTTSDVFLRKYEERIVTLPTQYKSSMNMGAEPPNFSGIGVVFVDGKYKENVEISYKRHDNIEPGALYCEALSGSQTYLNALANLSERDEQWAMRLVENGLLRILIMDERVCAFLKDHGDAIKNAYEAMHISVADTEQKPDFDPEETTFPDLMKVPLVRDDDDAKDTDFDVVVIHQGIIDKWWPNAHSSSDVSNILQSLRDSNRSRRSRFVVVTTGRGRPDNIPDNEKVLAFSSIESFLFKRYPEKLNLVDTIMNILPGSPERNNEDA